MLLKYPYLSVILNKKTNEQAIGLIQLVSKYNISFYNLNKINNEDVDKFFKLANLWWNMNHNLPISIYYKNIFNEFNYMKSCLSNNEYSIIDGYSGVNLKNLAGKRIKRKLIHLESLK